MKRPTARIMRRLVPGVFGATAEETTVLSRCHHRPIHRRVNFEMGRPRRKSRRTGVAAARHDRVVRSRGPRTSCARRRRRAARAGGRHRCGSGRSGRRCRVVCESSHCAGSAVPARCRLRAGAPHRGGAAVDRGGSARYHRRSSESRASGGVRAARTRVRGRRRSRDPPQPSVKARERPVWCRQRQGELAHLDPTLAEVRLRAREGHVHEQSKVPSGIAPSAS